MSKSTEPDRRHGRVARGLIATALLAMTGCALAAAGVTSAHAAGIPEDECRMGSNNAQICAYVTDRVLRFGDQPGVLIGTDLTRTDINVVRGDQGVKGPQRIDYNDAGYEMFLQSYIPAPVALISYRASAIPNSAVTVRANFKTFEDEDPSANMSLTCESTAYLACETPPVFMKNRTGSAWYNWAVAGPYLAKNVHGFATVESRPLIVKILNMTDQPLVRSGDVRTNGMLRSEEVDDPATVNASIDDRTGVGYYHFYRDADRANSASFLYEFADGTAATSLTGGALEFTIDITADGSTDGSKCVPPTGILQNVECSVTMLGVADGTLQAVVAVGV